jgi:acyl-CoA thioester hydrolase
MEQARVEFLEDAGYVLSENAAFVIVNAGCTFMIPLTYPGTVELKVYTGQPGRSSIPTTYELRLHGDERLFAVGDAKIIWIDASTGKSVPIPDALRLVLEGA